MQREYIDPEDNEKHIVGLLTEHIKVIHVSSTDSSKITLAATEEQIADLIVGLVITDKEDAELIPMLSYQSASAQFEPSTYFDNEQTRNYIKTFADTHLIINEVEEIEEVQQEPVYQQPTEEIPVGEVQE